MNDLMNQLNRLGAETEFGLSHFMEDERMYLHYLTDFPSEPSMPALAHAMEEEDFAAAERAAHALKGVAANLGLVSLMDEAMDVLGDLRSYDLPAARADFPRLKELYEKTVAVINGWKEAQQ